MQDWVIPTATILSVLLAAIGLLLAARQFRKQTHLAAFLEYTRRFNDLMKELPREIGSIYLEHQRDLPPPSREQTEALDRVVALLSQEFYLYKTGYLGKDIWQIWEPGIKAILRSPLLARDWSEVEHRYSDYPKFIRFVEEARGER